MLSPVNIIQKKKEGSSPSVRAELPPWGRELEVRVRDSGEKFPGMSARVTLYGGGGMSAEQEGMRLAESLGEVGAKRMRGREEQTIPDSCWVKVWDIPTGEEIGTTYLEFVLKQATIPLIRQIWTPPYQKFDHLNQFLGDFRGCMEREMSRYLYNGQDAHWIDGGFFNVEDELREVCWGKRGWDDTLTADAQIYLWQMFFHEDSTFPSFALECAEDSIAEKDAVKMVGRLREILAREGGGGSAERFPR